VKKFTGVIFFSLIIFASALVVFPLAISAQTEDEAKEAAMEKAMQEAKPKVPAEIEFRKKLEEPISEEKPEELSHQEIDAYIRYLPDSKVKAMSGEIGIIDSANEYSAEFKVFGKLPVSISLVNKYTSIENTTPVELPAHLTGFAADLETTFPFFNLKNTYLRLGVSPSFYTDNWGFNSSAFRIPSRYILIYQPNEKWTFISGIAVFPDFETKVFPIGGFIYKPNDKLTFNFVPKRPNITYAFNKKLEVFGEAGISSEEFEVKKDNLNGVILQYKENHLGAGLRYKFNKYIKSSLQTGYMFRRSLKYRDSLGKVGIKDSIFTEFRVEIEI
jgi:hypothetical protein